MIKALLLVTLAATAFALKGHDDENEFCVKTEDCVHAPYDVCLNGLCQHKGIFPVFVTEWIGCVTLSFMSLLRNIGGLGGVNIPICMALFGFTTKQSIALSGVLNFGGGAIKYILDLDERHPLKDATVIDYNLVLLMQPLILLGAFIGVQFSVTMPKISLGAMLTIMVVYLFFKTWGQARRKYAEESSDLKQVEEEKEKAKIVPASETQSQVVPVNSSATAEEIEQFNKIKEMERSNCNQLWKQALAVLSVLTNFFFVNMRGSAKKKSWIGITRCGEYDFYLTSFYLIFSLAFTWLSYRIVIREQTIKEKARPENKSQATEMRMDFAKLRHVSIYSVAGGFISGAFNMMAGSVFQPVLIDMGVPPQVTSATSIYMVTLSSMASTVMYAAAGQVDLKYAIWLSFWNILGSLIGYKQIMAYIKKTRRQSLIIYTMVFILGVSVLLVPIFAIKEAIQEKAKGIDILEVKDICS